MNGIMNEKGRQTKLLAAIAVLAMVICAFAVVIPSDFSAAVGDEYTLEDGPVTVIDKDGNVVNGNDGKPISTLEDALAQTSYAGQTWTLSAGTYNVTGGDTTSNYSALVIKQDGLTIQGAGIGQTTITNDKMTGSSAYTAGSAVTANQQATIVVDANNVTIKNMSVENTMIPQNEGYKCMEVFGSDTTIDTVSFELNSSAADDSTATSGVLINSTTDIGDTTITGCIFNNGLINIGYLNATGTLSIVDTVMNVESQGGFGISTYNPNDKSNNDAALDITEARNLEINVDASITNGGSLINMSPSGTTINVNESLTLSNDVTINTGVTVNIAAEKTVTAGTDVDVTLEGRLAGAGKLNLDGNTMNVLPGSDYNSNNVTGGSITGSTTWQDVILQGTYDSVLDGKSNQKVTVVDDLVIGSNAVITIAGQFIVNEGATVTVESGAIIKIESGATVQIDGDVTIEGSSVSDATFAFNGSSMTVNGSVVLDGANSYSCNASSKVTVNGTFEVGEEATADFGSVTVADGGELIIYGLASGNVLNNGTVTINTMGVPGAQGYFNNDFNVQMGNGAVLDGISIVGTITVSDSDLTFRTNGKDVAAKYDNSIVLKDVAGVVVTERMEVKTDADSKERYGDNAMAITGNIIGSSHIETITQTVASGITISGTNGKGQVIIDEDVSMTDVKLTVNNGTELKVSGNLTMTKTAGGSNTNAPLDGEGFIYVSSAEITVTGSITSNTQIDGTTVNAAMYMDSNPVMYHYTTLEAALASGATKITVTGTIDVTADATIPVGTTVDAKGATVNIDENATLTVAAQDRDSGKLQNDSGTINVEGTLVVENLDRSNVNANNVVSDTSKESGDAMSFTNIYNALENAQSGETVKITKTGDQTVTLDRNVEVKTGVTLEIPSAKKVVVDNDIIMTVNGTVYVNNGTLEIKGDSATPDVEDDAGVVTINGMLKSVASADIYKDVIAGAYFGYDNLSVIAPLATAADLIDEIETSQIVLYLENEASDVSFDYTGTDIITLVNNGKLIAGNIDLGTIIFEASANTSTTATFVMTNGTVDLDNVNGITIRDIVTYDDDNNAVYTATVSGENVGAFDNKETTEITEGGTVTIGGEVSSGATYGAVVDMAVPAGAVLTTTGGRIANIDVAGTLTATGTTNIGIASVTGTIGVDEAKLMIETLYAGVTAEKKIIDENTTRYVLTVGAGTAVIGEGVSVTKVAYVAPGTTVSETITDANGIKSTEYYVDDALFVTAYAAVDTPISDIEAPAEHAEFVEWQYDNNGKMTGVGKANIGQSDAYGKVYANINYNIYDIDVSACPGATVYIDGKEWNDYVVDGSGIVISGTKYAYGAHTITVYVAPGYEGTANITVNGQAVTSGTFELTGDTEIVVTGITAIDYSQIGGSSGSDDGLGLTDYLLIILVILIVIMAIMVAMRLMRS